MATLLDEHEDEFAEALEKKAEELGIKVEVNQDKIDKMVIQPKEK